MANGPNGDDGAPTFVRITNQMVYTELQATRADLRSLANELNDYPELKKRVRALELRFYGVLAGVIGTMGVLVFGTPAIAIGMGVVTVVVGALGVIL